MKEGFIGVDIGTSSVRAVLFDLLGNQKCISSKEYTVFCCENGRAELDAELLFNSAISVIRDCVNNAASLGFSIEGLGLSCQMHSLVCVDKSGSPITGVMTWADVRAVKEADFIGQNYDVKGLYNITGCRIQHPMYPLSKILWLKNNNREVFDRTYKFITIKEYIIFKLYGEYIVDYTLAGCQGLFNMHSFKWDSCIIEEILEITTDRLSEPVECTFCLKGMDLGAAGSMGINSDIPVIIGAGDGIMANLGCGGFDHKVFSSTIGTSGALRVAVDRPLTAQGMQTWCYPFLKGKWVAGGAINNGGIVLNWLKDEFREQFESDAEKHGESIYKLFDRYCCEVNAGSDRLVFLPYLTGERSPDWNASVRGIMYGLSLVHGRKHIVRAAMEGIIYRLFSVYEILVGMNTVADRIIAGGGYVRSQVWLKMQADIFNKDIYVTPVAETSALGAAYLCMATVGALGRYGEILHAMKPQYKVQPDAETHEVYKEAYSRAMEIYRRLYGNGV